MLCVYVLLMITIMMHSAVVTLFLCMEQLHNAVEELSQERDELRETLQVRKRIVNPMLQAIL
jgi:hypothetical protein